MIFIGLHQRFQNQQAMQLNQSFGAGGWCLAELALDTTAKRPRLGDTREEFFFRVGRELGFRPGRCGLATTTRVVNAS
jgi:hypothetical protein